jgi:hypothetical protein
MRYYGIMGEGGTAHVWAETSDQDVAASWSRAWTREELQRELPEVLTAWRAGDDSALERFDLQLELEQIVQEADERARGIIP